MPIHNSTQLVVRKHSPWRLPIILVGALCVAALGSWLVFDYGRVSAKVGVVQLEEQRDQLLELINQLENERDQMRDQLAVARRSSDVDRQATDEIKAVVRRLQDEALELKEELAFYRNIISPNVGKAGLRVQQFKLYGSGEQRDFHFKLMLTQVLQNTRLARGEVRIYIDGLQEGAPRKLNYHEVTTGTKNLEFKFKYFQNLEGGVRLPEKFIPTSVTLEVLPRVRGLHKITESYEWASVREEA